MHGYFYVKINWVFPTCKKAEPKNYKYLIMWKTIANIWTYFPELMGISQSVELGFAIAYSKSIVNVQWIEFAKKFPTS